MCRTGSLDVSGTVSEQQQHLHMVKQHILPDMVVDETRANSSRLVMINTGGIRFDIFKGRFTRDSAHIVSPFTSGFRYVKDVPFDKASKLLSILNNNGQVLEEMDPRVRSSMLAPVKQCFRSTEILPENTFHVDGACQVPLTTEPGLTLGYTIEDDAGSDGDDTVHLPITFYKVPNVIQCRIDAPSQIGDPQLVDVIYIEYIEPWLPLAFQFLDLDYSKKDTAIYMEEENLTNLLTKWVTANWKDNC